MHGRLLHRLLATQFIPNPDGKQYIDHIDRNRANNDLSNLRWCSCSENQINKPVKNEEHRNIEFNKSSKLYIVVVKRDKKKHYVGSAKTLEEAKTIRNAFLTSVVL